MTAENSAGAAMPPHSPVPGKCDPVIPERKKHKHTHKITTDGRVVCVYCGEEMEL